MRGLLTALVLALATACAPSPAPSQSPSVPTSSPAPSSPGTTLSGTPRATPARPLAGVHVALDPGHQLGNHNFPAETGRLVDAGGLEKPCNTTGTATADGWPEATLVFQVARTVQRRLTSLGATVSMTRTSNSERRWGPCIDERGRFPARVGADLLVSLHADGAAEGESGFHVIAPPGRPAARRLAVALRAALVAEGIPRSSYVAEGLSIRADLGTLNLSTVPAAMVELGNMVNPRDAARMRSRQGQAAYADGVVSGIRVYLRR